MPEDLRPEHGLEAPGFDGEVGLAVPHAPEHLQDVEPELRVAQHYLDRGLEETGATNLVASVILDYRAFDTLGEVTVLFAVVVAVLAIVRPVGRKKIEQAEEESDG